MAFFSCSLIFSNRRGSVALMAFTALAVIFIAGYAFHQMSVNSVLQIYRFKVNEKAMTLGDALVEASKTIAQDMANAGQFDSWFDDLASGKESVDEAIFEVSSNGVEGIGDFKVNSAMTGLIQSLSEMTEDGKETFQATVYLSLKKDKDFVSRSHYIDDPQEMRGTVTLRVSYVMSIEVFKKQGKSYVKTSPKEIETRFEFKRALVQPLVVRHFSFFGQDMSGGTEEKAGDFLKGRYNKLAVDANGNSESPFISLQSSASDPDVEGISGNPFKDSVGYILFGTGGSDEKQVYLNLAAGNGNAAESFHLYRGGEGESDFYRLYTSDYRTLIQVKPDELEMDGTAPGQIAMIRSLVNNPSDVDPTQGFPFYYLARKDYGYAKEWATHPEFGFTEKSADRIRANNFHLFGSGSADEARFSVVFGNVLRRCLSLSGYKQVKGSREGKAKSKTRDFEIQAGPIYYYRDFNQLHAHKLYLDKRYSEGSGSTNYRQEAALAPIEVWDSRMNWSFQPLQDQKPSLKGSWIFVSGDGLMGRLIPTIARLHPGTKSLNLYMGAVSLHERASSPSTIYKRVQSIANGDGRYPADKTRWVSPLIQAIYEIKTAPFSKGGGSGRGEGFPHLFKVSGKRLTWSNKAQKMSAYTKELLLMFYHTSAQAYVRILQDKEMLGMMPGLSRHHQLIVQDAAKTWKESVVSLINDEVEDKKQEDYLFSPFSGSWADRSRALKRNQWSDGSISQGSSKGPAYYFTVPDPWQIALEKEINSVTGQDQRVKDLVHARTPLGDVKKGAFNQAVKTFSTGSESGAEELFREYFSRVMTDPAWPLPYNYSTRFAKEKIKRYYFRGDPEASDDRDEFMTERAVPEFRDAIGYFNPRVNPYLRDTENKPLNNKIQKEIFSHYKAKYKGGDFPAYYFVKEMKTARSLESLDLDQLYKGRCMFSYSKRKDFDARFRQTPLEHNYKLGATVCYQGSLELVDASFEGGGVLVVSGPVIIKGSRFNGGGLTLVSPRIRIEGMAMRLEQVSLIQTGEGPFHFRADEIRGNLVVKKPVEVMRKGVLSYDAGFLKAQTYVVGFQPYISQWAWGIAPK
jgi:hypothetical protein